MIIGIFLFFFGLIIGSFLNAFLWRYEKKKSLSGRSMCPKCLHQIAWFDNVPLISYFLLGGKCRHCKKPISIQYPIVELLTGLSFLIIGLFSKPGQVVNDCLNGIFNFQLSISNQDIMLSVSMLILLLLITSLLLLIVIYDIKTKEIPNGFNLTFIVSAAIYTLLSCIVNPNFLFSILYFSLAGVAAFLFFYSFVFFSKETWMGGGDAKLAFGIGLFLGPLNTFVAILLASVIGSIYGLSMIGLNKYSRSSSSKRSVVRFDVLNLKSEIPFGPFLALGTFLSFLFNSQLVLWYAKIFLRI